MAKYKEQIRLLAEITTRMIKKIEFIHKSNKLK